VIDPAYAHELDELARLCRGFGRLRELNPADLDPQLLLVGAITAQCAAVYNLSPPGGLLDPGSLFTGGPPTEDGDA
jgi:hypothetical protein